MKRRHYDLKRRHYEEILCAAFMARLCGGSAAEAFGFSNGLHTAVWHKKYGDMTYELLAHPGRPVLFSFVGHDLFLDTLDLLLDKSGIEVTDD